MSSFSFDPSRPSAFQRLISGRVAAPGADPAAKTEQKKSSDVSIFNEVPAPSGGADVGPPVKAALSGLSSAVRNLNESTDTLAAMSGAVEEVQRSNMQASEVSVREVQSAVQVADELRNRIRDNLRLANEAQGKGLSSESIQRFLG
jgi:hypothetical protein